MAVTREGEASPTELRRRTVSWTSSPTARRSISRRTSAATEHGFPSTATTTSPGAMPEMPRRVAKRPAFWAVELPMKDWMRAPPPTDGEVALDAGVGEFDVERRKDDFTVLDELWDDGVDGIDWNGEAYARGCARGCEYRGIDTDETTSRIQQRTAAIPGIDRRVGLNRTRDERTDLALNAAIQSTHHARGQRVIEPERVTYGEHGLPHAHAVRARRNRRRL